MSLCCPGWPQISVLKGSSHLRLLGAGATGPSHTGLTAVFFTSVRGFFAGFPETLFEDGLLTCAGIQAEAPVLCEV